MEREEVFQKARKKAERRVGFYIHLTVYVLVLLLLLVINLYNSPDNLWVRWPFLGWSIGLFFHFLGVFVFSNGASLTEKLIDKEMKKEASKKK